MRGKIVNKRQIRNILQLRKMEDNLKDLFMQNILKLH